MVDLDNEAGKAPISQTDSNRYREMSNSGEEDESPIAKLQKTIGGLFGGNFKIIAIILVLIALGALFYLLQPKSTSLSLELSLLDSPGVPVVDAQVSLLLPDEKSAVPDGFSDDLGNVRFDSVPADKDLTLKIVPMDPSLNIIKKPIRLKANEGLSLDFELEKRNALSVDNKEISLTLAEGCPQKLQIEVTNLGESDFETSLVGDLEIKKLILENSAPSKNIPAGGKEILEATIGIPPGFESVATGTLHLKETSRKIALTIRKNDKKPRMDVAFIKSDVKEFSSSITDLPVVKKTQVRLRNAASTGAMPLSEIKVSVLGDFAPWVDLDLSTLEAANSQGGIAPQQEVLFGIAITVPEGTPKGPYSGQLIVSSSCESKPIALSAKIEESSG